MKRKNEFAVGLSVLLALVLVVAAALWLSEAHMGRGEQTFTARFRAIEGLTAGSPVTLRGVKVGKVVAVRLAPGDWVEIDFTVGQGVEMPAKPAVVASASSLFGEWTATITALEPLPDDPNMRADLLAAAAAGGDAIPGTTLPDIGQLTAQASRIATDIAGLTDRIQNTFDSAAVKDMRRSILALASVTNRLAVFAEAQTGRLDRISGNAQTASDAAVAASRSLQTTMGRVDAATANGEIQAIVGNGKDASADLRQAAADLRSVMAAARQNQASLVGVIQSADSLMQKIQRGQGTLGMLATDSALYRETTLTMRQFRELLTDLQAHPRKYLKISVF
ncbi:MAG TPA: MlaD family protein [Gemmatimonadales bacterium]|nr:MlaD family protein [Gemmatimonadales bacterium]